VSVMVAMLFVYWTRLFGREQHGRRDFLIQSDEQGLNEKGEEKDGMQGIDGTVKEGAELTHNRIRASSSRHIVLDAESTSWNLPRFDQGSPTVTSGEELEGLLKM